MAPEFRKLFIIQKEEEDDVEKSIAGRCLTRCARWVICIGLLGLSALAQSPVQNPLGGQIPTGGGFVTCFPEQPKVYHFTKVSYEQKEQLDTRNQIQKLINQTYADELQGIVDLKKYDEIRALINKLPSKQTEPAKKKSVFAKLFR